MMIKVGKKELLSAVDKAAVRCKETFCFTISSRKASDGRVFATVSASDGNVQVMASFMAIASEEKRFFIGSELLDVLKATGEFGEEYTIEVSDTTAIFSAGDATMPLPLKQDGLLIMMQTPKDGCINARFDREAFVKAVRQGAFAYGDEACSNNIAFTVALRPVTDENGSRLYLVSSDGKMVARSCVKALEAADTFKNAEPRYISLEAPALRTICSKMESENIDIMIFTKQVSIRDGNDFYTIVRYESIFPEAFGNLLDATDYNYRVVFDVSTLKAALKVATILEEKNEKKALITIDNGQVTVSSVQCQNKAQVKAENIEGGVSIIVNSKHLETSLSGICADKVTVYGLGDLKPLYITAEGVNILTAPIPKQ